MHGLEHKVHLKKKIDNRNTDTKVQPSFYHGPRYDRVIGQAVGRRSHKLIRTILHSGLKELKLVVPEWRIPTRLGVPRYRGHMASK